MEKIKLYLSRLEPYFVEYNSLILCLFTVLLYWPVLTAKKLIDIDYQILIGVLDKIQSFEQYYHSFAIMDVQPFRDLVIISLAQISKMIGFSLYGPANVFIWLITAIYFHRTIIHFIPKIYATLITLLILTHPLLTWVISWPAAIKHLLACLFITISTYQTIRYRIDFKSKRLLMITIFYLLAILSQPIIILWPFIFFMLTYRQKRNSDYLVFLGLLFFSMIFFTYLNYIYYSELYPLKTGVSKITTYSTSNFAVNILAISRSLTQILFPISFAQFYRINNPLNVIGIFALLPLVFYAYRVMNHKTFLVLISLVFFPLIVIYTRETNIFVSDTYLITSLLSVFAFIAFIFFKDYRPKKSIFLLVLISLFSLKSFSEIKYTVSPFERYQITYHREPNCRNTLAFANQLMVLYEFQKFKEIASQALANHCILIGANSADTLLTNYALLMYLRDDIDNIKKIDLLEKIDNDLAIIFKLLQKLYLKENNIEKADEMKKKIGTILMDKKLADLLIEIDKKL